MIRRVLLGLLALLLLLAAAVAINTLRQGSRQLQVPPAPPLAIDAQAVAGKLAGAIRLRTIADRDDPQAGGPEFLRLHAYLQERFPRVHATLQRETVGPYSLLYTWPGSDPQARPVMFLAHQDVVPISPGTEVQWEVPPFEGRIQDGYVWGRGAWDDKVNIVAQLEAAEMLLASGFQPRQTVYFGFGHDEEVSGQRGALQIARLLQSRGVRLDFVLDEGLLIADGILPGLRAPAALVGVAEKGFLSVVLEAAGTPGHSSMPPPPGTSAIGTLSGALQRIDGEQMPAGIRGVAREMFETLAPEMGGMQRVALSNLWLFEPLVQAQLQRGASTNAMIRTTTALTIVEGGNRENVLPGNAQATVNFRLLPGDTRADVMAHVRSKLGPGVKATAMAGSAEPSPISPTSAPAYGLLNRTIRSLFPEVVVAPGLMIAGTDSHHYAIVSDNIYRFSPVRARPGDLSRFHGTNERIAVANLGELVRFYHQLLRNLNAPAS